MEKLYVIRNRNERKKEKINNPENEKEKGKGKEKRVLHGAPKKARRSKIIR